MPDPDSTRPGMTPNVADGPEARASVVEVMAPWCGACRAMKDDLAEVAASYRGRVELVVVDAATSPDEARRLGVRGTPTLIGYRGRDEVFRVVGRRPLAELDGLFGSLVSQERRPVATSNVAERRLRIGAGVVLGGVGLTLGPAWPLVVVGAAVVVYGLATGR